MIGDTVTVTRELDRVMTVTGPVKPHELGTTLCHEHVFLSLWEEFGRNGVFNDPELAVIELSPAVEAGVRTIVDCTPIGVGRDPEALVTVAARTGLNVVMGTGFYRHPYLDRRWFDAHEVDSIAAVLIREIVHGVGDSGVKAGIIGEVASNADTISAAEERSFRAAARAHLETGVTITTHAACWPVGIRQLDILESEGVEPHRVIIGHCDTVADAGYHRELAERGAYVEFDTIRRSNTYEHDQRIAFIRTLADSGHLDRILLSQDVCLRVHLKTYGGSGYDYLFTEFVPELTRAGFDAADIDTLLVDNPRRAMTGSEPS